MDAPRARRLRALLALLPAALLAACSGGPGSGAADQSGDATLSVDLYETDVRPPTSEEQGEPNVSQEFMCHVIGGIRTLDEHDARMGVVSLDNRFATLSQGQYHKEYPRGFGVPCCRRTSSTSPPRC